jgi:hypothetical protein
LSPAFAPEFVKPAASFPDQAWNNQRLMLSCANVWKLADAVPMYVGELKVMASVASSCAPLFLSDRVDGDEINICVGGGSAGHSLSPRKSL